MEFVLTLVLIVGFCVIAYRAMASTKELEKSGIEPPTPVAPILTQQIDLDSKEVAKVDAGTVAETEPTPKKARKPRAKKSAE